VDTGSTLLMLDAELTAPEHAGLQTLVDSWLCLALEQAAAGHAETKCQIDLQAVAQMQALKTAVQTDDSCSDDDCFTDLERLAHADFTLRAQLLGPSDALILRVRLLNAAHDELAVVTGALQPDGDAEASTRRLMGRLLHLGFEKTSD